MDTSVGQVVQDVFGKPPDEAGQVVEHTNYDVHPVRVDGKRYQVHLLREPAHTGTHPANQAPFQEWASENGLSFPIHRQGDGFCVFEEVDLTLLKDLTVDGRLVGKLAEALFQLHKCPVTLGEPEHGRVDLAIKFATDGGSDWRDYAQATAIMDTLQALQPRYQKPPVVVCCHFNLRPHKIGVDDSGRILFTDFQCSAQDHPWWELGKLVAELDLDESSSGVLASRYMSEDAPAEMVTDVRARAFVEAVMTYSWDVMRKVRLDEARKYHQRAIGLMPRL